MRHSIVNIMYFGTISVWHRFYDIFDIGSEHREYSRWFVRSVVVGEPRTSNQEVAT